MENSLATRLIFVDADKIRASCNAWVNASNTILVSCLVDQRINISYTLHSNSSDTTVRQDVIINYVNYLMSFFDTDTTGKESRIINFAFQGDDRPTDATSVSWQTQKSFLNVCLVPDFYYVRNQGYQNFMAGGAPPWQDRLSRVFWRGSTTGGFGNTLESLPTLIRYRLCNIGLSLGKAADFGFVSVVQARSPDDANKIEAFLLKADLLKSYTDIDQYTKYKLIVQIDGNGNSWELVKKLRLGCCMLLVDSEWLLWHNRLLKPWVHFVPIKSDLSDFVEKVEWCFANDERAGSIASAGREFAMSIDFDAEMRSALKAVYEQSRALL